MGILVISVSAFLFIDLYMIRHTNYYKFLTSAITATLLLLSLSAVFFMLNIKIDLTIDQAISNTLVLNLILFVIFFSLREGATSNYFKRKIETGRSDSANSTVVDTSAIIDGRIISLCEAKIITNKLTIPEFVIREMQLISDSSNHEKRKKGRRGLDLLKKMKSSDTISINILPVDYDFLRGVDNKLLHFAKEENALLISTDFNLIKVAEVEGVSVLNINKVASILKPPYSVYDKIKVNISKKGNSVKQGIGYLDDDTMVVIEEGEKFIGQTKIVQVTSFVQSDSGKMIFGRLI